MPKACAATLDVSPPEGAWSFLTSGPEAFRLAGATSAVVINGRTVGMSAWRSAVVHPAVPVEDDLGVRSRTVVGANIWSARAPHPACVRGVPGSASDAHVR